MFVDKNEQRVKMRVEINLSSEIPETYAVMVAE